MLTAADSAAPGPHGPAQAVPETLEDALAICADRSEALGPARDRGASHGFLCAVPWRGTLLWPLAPSVHHLLRDLVGPGPLVLATGAPKAREMARDSREDPGGHSGVPRDSLLSLTASSPEPTRRPLTRHQCIRVGPRPAGSLATLLGDNHDKGIAAPFRDVLGDLPWEPALLSQARQMLASYAEEAGKAKQGSTDPPRPPMLVYCKQPSHLPQHNESQYLGLVCRGQTPSLDIVQIKTCGLVSMPAGNNSMPTDPALTTNTSHAPPPPTLETLLADVGALAGLSNDAVKLSTAGHVTSRYDVLAGNSSTPGTDTPPSPTSTITVHVGSVGLVAPFTPPPSSASVQVTIQAVAAHLDPDNYASSRDPLEELALLESWNTLAQEPAMDRGANPADNMKCSQEVDTFIEAVQANGALPTRALALAMKPKRSALDPDTDLPILHPLPERQDYDFSELVWCFLSRATGVDDLTDALTAIIDALETFVLKPMVNKSNPTSFARVIRQCLTLSAMETSVEFEDLRQELSILFDEWLAAPVALLVEIGAWKLQRDYRHFLVETVSYARLGSFLDHTLDVSSQVASLKALHRVVELWALVKNNLGSLPPESLQGLVSAAVEHYQKALVASHTNTEPSTLSRIAEDTVVYSLGLPKYSAGTQKVVAGLVKSFDPSSWVLTVAPRDPPGPSKAWVSVFAFAKQDPQGLDEDSEGAVKYVMTKGTRG